MINNIEITKENMLKYFDSFNGFIKHNNIHIESLEDDKAVLYADLSDNSLNPGGIVHGGLLFGLADSAMGSLAYLTKKPAVTIDSTINYLKPCKGKVVKCIATPVKVGKTIAVYKAEIYNEKEELSAVVTANYMFIG